ncbi:MAG: hypothetical protein AAF467_09015 [Actinomycetota bacterium]
MPTVRSHDYDIDVEVTCPANGPTLLLVAGRCETQRQIACRTLVVHGGDGPVFPADHGPS